MHYKRWKRHGNPEKTVRASVKESLRERFERVGWTEEGACWLWNGRRDRIGYGVLDYQNRTELAHRIAYTARIGPIPEGHVVRHTCDNPPCVNPEHLLLGTQRENMNDMTERFRFHAKLSEKQIQDIRKLFQVGVTQTRIAEHFGVHQSQISRIVRGRAWIYVGDP